MYAFIYKSFHFDPVLSCALQNI